MREALRESLTQPGEAHYPKGSIVLCTACGKPLYVLERGIAAGESTGRAVNDLKPVTPALLETLAANRRIDPGIQAWAKSLTPVQRMEHCAPIPLPRTGDPMICPHCHQVYVQARAVTGGELIDQAYVVELVVIHPDGRTRVPNSRTLTWRPN